MARKNTFDKKADEEMNQTGEFADNRDIFGAVEALSNALQDIMTYSDNPSATGFALKYIIQSFYSTAYVIEAMQQQVGEAMQKKDLSAMNNIKRRCQYITINKAFHMEWNELGRAWDKFLESNNLSSPDFPDSVEIAKNRRNYTSANREKQLEEEAKTIMFDLTNMI